MKSDSLRFKERTPNHGGGRSSELKDENERRQSGGGIMPPARAAAIENHKHQLRRMGMDSPARVDENGQVIIEFTGDRIELNSNELRVLGMQVTRRKVKFLLVSLFFSVCASIGAAGYLVWRAIS